MTSKGQTVSMDVLIAIAIFIIVVALFISVGSDIFTEEKSLNLEKEANSFLEGTSALREEKLPLLEGNQIDEDVLVELATTQAYYDIKRELGLRADFCVYFEDETGSILRINETAFGVGTSEVSINGNSC